MACDDEIIPLQERIETVGEDADLQEVYETFANEVSEGDAPPKFLNLFLLKEFVSRNR